MIRSRFKIMNIYKNFVSEERSLVELKRDGATISIFISIDSIDKIAKNILKEDLDYIYKVTKINQSL